VRFRESNIQVAKEEPSLSLGTRLGEFPRAHLPSFLFLLQLFGDRGERQHIPTSLRFLAILLSSTLIAARVVLKFVWINSTALAAAPDTPSRVYSFLIVVTRLSHSTGELTCLSQPIYGHSSVTQSRLYGRRLQTLFGVRRIPPGADPVQTRSIAMHMRISLA